MSEPVQVTLFLPPRGHRARVRITSTRHAYETTCGRYLASPTSIARHRASADRVERWHIVRVSTGERLLAAGTLRDALRALAEVDPSVETTGQKRRKR